MSTLTILGIMCLMVVAYFCYWVVIKLNTNADKHEIWSWGFIAGCISLFICLFIASQILIPVTKDKAVTCNELIKKTASAPNVCFR